MLILPIDSIGINITLWNPQEFYKNGATCDLIWSNLFWLQSTTPILVTATMSYTTPKAFANIACYFDCPSF